MREFRKKQFRLKKIMNALVIFSAVFWFVYIGIEPMVSGIAAIILGYCGDCLIVASMAVLFAYFSRYGKSDKFLETIEYELSDAGYYYTSRKNSDIDSYSKAVVDDLRNSGFAVDENIEIDDFNFNAKAVKNKEFFYIVCDNNIDKNDIIAYQDSAIYDVTAVMLKRSGNGVVLFITDHVSDDAVALSKMITPLGKKENIKFALAIVEISSGRCYFLGNKPTKCQQMIANYAMNCNLPLKEEYIGSERLKFQDDLEEHMKEFNIKDYKNGTFYAH